jgi:hypothetical protein
MSMMRLSGPRSTPAHYQGNQKDLCMMVKHTQVAQNTRRMQRLFLAFIFGMVTIIAVAFAMKPHNTTSTQRLTGVAQPMLVTTPVPDHPLNSH